MGLAGCMKRKKEKRKTARSPYGCPQPAKLFIIRLGETSYKILKLQGYPEFQYQPPKHP